MRSLYVSVPDDTAEKLRRLAARERRAPRQQAAVLLMDALSRLEIASELRPDDQDPVASRERRR